mgnify:CR=1 FL=1
MIELKNICKTYKSKKSSNTKALDNVSIQFDQKGMTFILGKSGSGKSTLLNVLGGLDKYDTGDMIILGKSSKNFNQADFDSYRNTYIGFVFQEFNILEDYNVYENIVLALQLQQKETDTKAVNELLQKLELTDLKNRKVNELSGGQKQRVAIARALIKNPKIILADEPTGNLDSTTGKQVMDLLKEISKEKLVIVVSHDQESANTYGDRIIEIKDGKIINDTKKQEFLGDEKIEYKTIKSKLPWKESFKLGIGSLRHKKIKLIFTILLTTCSLLFLGIMDTLSSYDIHLAHSKLLKEKNEKFIEIEKYHRYSNDDYVNKENMDLKEEDIKYILERIKQDYHFTYGVRDTYYYQNIYDVFHISSKHSGYGYTYGSLALQIVEDSQFAYLEDYKIIGRKPTSKDEVVISNVIADLMILNGVNLYNNEEVYTPKNYQDILKEENIYCFGNKGNVKIVGIIDYDLSKYKSALEKQEKNENGYIEMTDEESKAYTEYTAKLNNIYNKIFAMEGFTGQLKVDNDLPLSSTYHFTLSSNAVRIWQEGMYISPSIIHGTLEYFNGTEWVSTSDLKENQVVLNVNQLEDFSSEDYRKKVTEYINQNLGRNQLELEKEFFADYVKRFNYANQKATLKVQETGYGFEPKTYDLEIVGITGLITNSNNYYYVSSIVGNPYTVNELPITGVFILEDNQNTLKKLMETFPYNEDISLKSTYSYDVNDMVRTIRILKNIAFYVALVLVIFTVILIANFMFSSISYRKKEIGILRGLGARRTDTIKVFLWEGIVLATISFIISSIGLCIVTALLNNVVSAGTDILLTPFIVTIRQFIIVLVLVYLIVFISSILPIVKISRMRPTDAILKK